MSETIRPLVVGVPRRGDEVFVARLPDAEGGTRRYRAVGGAIEFGEASRAALMREFEEEFDVGVDVGPYLGTIENLFELDGTRGHEVVLVYEIERTPALWERSRVSGEDDGEVTLTGEWKALDAFDGESTVLFPGGLEAVLGEETTHVISTSEASE